MLLENGKYLLSGNIDPLQLAADYELPLYVYDGHIIEQQYEKLKKAFDVKKMKINYAMKALGNINILKLIKNLGGGVDCVSFQEVRMALRAGFSPENIMFTPSCIGIDELKQGIDAGVKITVDNIPVLEEFGQQFPDIPVTIRINPHIMAGFNRNISVGHIDSKFGISFHQIPHVKRILEATGLQLQGLHMHTGSDILDPGVFLQGAEILFSIAREFSTIEFIDFGSGFKVAYKEGDIETDVEELGELLSNRFNEFCKEVGKDLTLIFEPGKFLVSKSGYFLVNTNVIKQTTSTVFACVDSGLNHLIRPMFYNAYHHIVNLSNPEGKKRFYSVVGYICETDTFAVNRPISEVKENDVLCFYNAGAYSFSMASNYNARYRPAEVLVYKGKAHLIRKREDFEDLMRGQVEVL